MTPLRGWPKQAIALLGIIEKGDLQVGLIAKRLARLFRNQKPGRGTLGYKGTSLRFFRLLFSLFIIYLLTSSSSL